MSDIEDVVHVSALRIEDVKECKLCPNLGKHHAAAVGYAKARVMVIGDHPATADEIESGMMFSSEWGEYITFICDQAEMDREEWYFTSLAKCRPHGEGQVSDENVVTCMDRWLKKEIDIVRPEVILCCGKRVWHTLVPEAQEQVEEGKSSYAPGAYLRKNGCAFIALWHPKVYVKTNNIAPFVQVGDLVAQFLGA